MLSNSFLHEDFCVIRLLFIMSNKLAINFDKFKYLYFNELI